MVSGLTSSNNRAIQLAEFASVFGDTARVNQRIDRIARVTAADVQRVAAAFLTAENRTVVITAAEARRRREANSERAHTARRPWLRGRHLAAASHPSGQAPQAPPPSTISMKGKAPVSNTVLRVSLPKPKEADLPNGLHVMVIEDPRAPQVTMQLVIRGAGGYYDPPDHFGLAQFTAANLREGTAKRTSPEIAEQLERLAATVTVNAAMSSEDATLNASALREHFDEVLDLAADVVLTPAFPEQELTRYKAQTRAQLTQQRTSPNFLAFERFSLAVADGHPDGRMAPTVEALDKTTRASLAAFHKAHYVPDHAAIAITGDITMAAALKAIQTRFGGLAEVGRRSHPP